MNQFLLLTVRLPAFALLAHLCAVIKFIDTSRNMLTLFWILCRRVGETITVNLMTQSKTFADERKCKKFSFVFVLILIL